MNFPLTASLRALALITAALAMAAPARAALCTLTDTGTPILTKANPKPFKVPPPKACLVNGLPGVGSDLPGYIQVATRVADIVVSGVKVGNLHDRVYCLGTAGVCNGTQTYILATRVQMLATPVNFPNRNPNCPLWSGTSNDCFEINNVFRNIRGTNAAPVTAQVGYWMGSTAGSNDPNLALANKYMEYTGKTYKGLNQITPPGTNAADRDNRRVMFWSDANVFDPDGVNAPWTPWFFVKQNCPNGVITTNLPTDARTKFAIKYWQGGEEGQIQKNVQLPAYVCVP